MLSTEGRFTFKKERPIYSTQLSESVGISKVSFLSVDSERNKCLLPEGVGGGGVLLGILGVGVPPSSPNP